jgi:hypothetical protein
MPALGFTDQRARLRRILDNALAGAIYDSSERESDARVLVIHAHRGNGRAVTVTFRGVSDSEATAEPQPGASLRLKSVDLRRPALLALLDFILPFPQFRSPGSGYARVRIEAGAARLDIVCQDAEWWEEDAPRA